MLNQASGHKGVGGMPVCVRARVCVRACREDMRSSRYCSQKIFVNIYFIAYAEQQVFSFIV